MTNRRAPYNQGGIISSGSIPVPLAGDVNGPSNANHVDFLTGPGTGFVYLVTGTTLRLAGPAGTYPTTAGHIQTKNASATWWEGINAGGDANVLAQSGATFIIGDFGAAAGWFTNLRGFTVTIDGRNSITHDSALHVWATFGGVEMARMTPGENTLQFTNAASDPATPTGGPKLYAVSGAAKAIGTSGTITTFAAAEPHCPSCGKDFTTEHENRERGYGYLAVCLSCLSDFIEEKFGTQPWIRRERA